MTTPESVTLRSPSKINLGLEVVGRRTDGYHDIDSVMCMLELADQIRVFGGASGNDIPGVAAEENLVSDALAAFRAIVPGSPELGWRLEKRIPAAAGLGGASGNAAVALLAANALNGRPLSDEALTELAGTIGSDVPFFLGGPAAIVTGRGTTTCPFQTWPMPVLLLVPNLEIPEKTGKLYDALTAADFSNEGQSRRVRSALESRRLPGKPDLFNSFLRPLCSIEPRMAGLGELLDAMPDLVWGLSGAGPTCYALCDGETAHTVQSAVNYTFGDWIRCIQTYVQTVPMNRSSR